MTPLTVGPRTSVELDRSVEDREEIREYFDGNPCCSLGPNKGACWIRVGGEKMLAARQESLDLVDIITNIFRVVEESSMSGKNKAQLTVLLS